MTEYAKQKIEITEAEFEAAKALVELPPLVCEMIRRYLFSTDSLTGAATVCGLSKQLFTQKIKRVLKAASGFRAALVRYEAYQHEHQIEP